MNFDFDIKKKRVKIMLVALIGLISYAFLPYVKGEALGRSESGSFFSGDVFFEDGFGFASFIGLICIVAFIGIIATAYMKKNNENLLCCLGGGAAGVVSLIATLISLGNFEDELAKYGLEVSYSAGIGFWIGIIALIACAAMAFLLPEDSNQ